jgi:hypothetical protein
MLNTFDISSALNKDNAVFNSALEGFSLSRLKLSFLYNPDPGLILVASAYPLTMKLEMRNTDSYLLENIIKESITGPNNSTARECFSGGITYPPGPKKAESL